MLATTDSVARVLIVVAIVANGASLGFAIANWRRQR